MTNRFWYKCRSCGAILEEEEKEDHKLKCEGRNKGRVYNPDVWVCPKCGLKVEDEFWRREKTERTICRNGHSPTQMKLRSH